MKHIFVCSLLFAASFLNAQDSLKIKTGFLFSAQGSLSLQTPSKGLVTFTPVSAVVSFIKGKSMVNVVYNMTSNKVGMLYWHKLGNSNGYYVACNKNVFTKGGYAGTGLTQSVADGKAIGFFEFGSTWHAWSPAIYMGAIMPLTFRIK
ncbi:MAG: hypothetical protein KBC12_03100 [Candidatus Pacebacteria bacterium]|nr:hypothetical protein [Candidatus Paceibacterota bacterium]